MVHYELRGILGFNCKYNLVLSDRGRGKSFDCKHFLMRQSGTAMCLYRNSSDMTLAMNSWIEPLISKNKDREKYEVYMAESFTWDGNEKTGFRLCYNGEPKIWFRYLTQVNHIKQEVFPDDMNWLWLDEFIPMAYKKLPGIESEGDAIRTIMKTIEHDSLCSREERGLKPCRMIMFGNPFTWNNPILSYFRVQPRYGRYRAGPDIAVEMLEPLPTERKGKLTVDEFLGDSVIKNQGWKEQMSFIQEKWPTVRPKTSIRFGDDYFTVYLDAKYQAYCRRCEGHSGCGKYTDGICEEGELVMSGRMRKYLKSIVYEGKIVYKNINDKFDFQNAIYTMSKT